MSEPSTAGYEQALRYAEELRDLYRETRDHADRLAEANRDLERREAELQALHAIDQSILGVVPFERTLEIAEAAIRRLAGADRVEVMMVDAAIGVLRTHDTQGPASEEPIPSSGVVASAILTGAARSGPPSPAGTSWERAAAEEGLDSCTVTPLTQAGEMVGVVAIGWRDGHSVEDAGIASIERIAAQLAVALQTSKLAADRTRRTAELEAVLDVSQAVAGSLELGRVLAAAVERSLALTGLQMGIVSLVDDRTDELVARATRGVPQPLLDLVARVPVSSPLGRLMLGETAEEIDDPYGDPQFGFQAATDAVRGAEGAMVAARLEWDGRLVGAIALGSLDRQAIGPEDQSFVAAIAAPLAAAIGNARLYERLHDADEQRRRLLSRLVRAQEEERLRIAGDIHDDSIQVMTATGMRLEVLRRRLGPGDHDGDIKELERVVTQAVARLRSLMFQLRPPALDREGLAAALRAQLEHTLSAPYALRNDIEREPDTETRVILYRIAQEALTNVRKHARASHVDIGLESRDGGVLVTIADDGVGFTPDDSVTRRPGHLGLVSMRERAEMAGGWLQIESSPGAGTVVRFWAPVQR